MNFRHTTIALCLGASTLAYAASASAQAAADQSKGNTGVEEIIVRAQRVEQSLQKVPVAVTPVTGKELETRRLHDLTQITTAVPSLQTTTDNAFTLRGIGSQIYSSNVDSSVGVMVDDVSLGVPVFMSNAAFVDMEQVEALTGPQGLLFGRNSSAGLLNIVTKKPEIGQFGGEANVEYDNRDAPGGHFGIVATGILNLPTSDNSALRLNVVESDQDPIAQVVVNKSPNYQGNQKRLMGKAKWLWKPTSDLSVYVVGDYSRERGVGGIWDDTFRTVGAGGTDAADVAIDHITPGTTNMQKGLSGAQYRNVDTNGISVNVTDKLSGNLTLSNIAAWRHYTTTYNLDVDNSSVNGADINGGHQNYNQYSEELRLAYHDSKLDGQVGLYGFWSNNTGNGAFIGAGGLGLPNFVYGLTDYHLTGRSLATYGQVSYHLTDDWQLIGGARVTNDHVAVDAASDNFPIVSYSTPLYGFINQLPFVIPFGPAQAYATSGDHTNFSYKLGSQYNLTSGTMVYATWSTGYKGPAMKTNILSTGESPYLKPETVTDLEVGIKAKLFDNKLRLNIAGFIEKFRNFQVQAFDAAGFQTLTNAEGVKASGVEINSTFKPLRALTINYNGTFSHSHFTDFSGDPCYLGQSAATCANGVSFNGAGIKTPASANYAGTLEGIYSVPVGLASVDLEMNWYHRSSVNFSTNAAPYQELGAIDVMGASISYHTDKGLNFSVFCKNCTNKIYPNYIQLDPLDASAGVISTINRWGYNSVRTIGASVGFKF
jgi:iron complex outermembrane recepter protein